MAGTMQKRFKIEWDVDKLSEAFRVTKNDVQENILLMEEGFLS